MKRFWCSIHKKIVRVRVMPSNVINAESSNPRDRVGECRWHSVGSPHAFFAAHQQPAPPKPVKTKKASQPEEKGGKR